MIEPLRKESCQTQLQEDNRVNKIDTGFISQITGTVIPVSKEAENSDQNKRRQENDRPQLRTDRDDKDDQNSENESETLNNSTASSKVVSTNTVALTTTVSIVALTKQRQSNNGTVKSNDLDKRTKVKKTEIRETPVKNESGTTTKANVIPTELAPSLAMGDVGESFKASALSGMKESHKRNDKEKPFIAVNNMLSKENLALEKRVRFSLEGDKTSSLLESDTKKQELTKEDPQLLFSDEEEGERECGSIDEDVSQRINRIQNLLRSDRLRTNRKRKNPVV